MKTLKHTCESIAFVNIDFVYVSANVCANDEYWLSPCIEMYWTDLTHPWPTSYYRQCFRVETLRMADMRTALPLMSGNQETAKWKLNP